MQRQQHAVFVALLLAATAGCGEEEGFVEGPVDFQSAGAQSVRHKVCGQDWDNAARKGAGAEDYNASTLWSVSPYQVLVPSTGEGHVLLNVDAPHFDWLIYTAAETDLEVLDGPEVVFNGPVEECPELGLVEYGVHHPELTSWPLVLAAEPMSRAQFYAGLATTDHSDLSKAGHAGHDLTGDADAPGHGGDH